LGEGSGSVAESRFEPPCSLLHLVRLLADAERGRGVLEA
jgi:hypothetical protein